MQVSLLAHRIRLSQPRDESGIDVAAVLEAKRMQMIPRRERLDLPKTSMLQAACNNHVTVEPSLSRRDLGERHADLKGDPCLLRKDDDRPDRANRGCDEVE